MMYPMVGLLVAALLWCGAVWADTGSYLIETTNDGQFHCASYWIEGLEIRFYQADGVIGIPKEAVTHIRKLAHPYRRLDGTPRPIAPANTEPNLAGMSEVTNSPPKSGLRGAFRVDVAAFAARAQDLMGKSQAELRALADQGVALREQIIASGDAYYQDLSLLKLYEVLEQISQALSQRGDRAAP